MGAANVRAMKASDQDAAVGTVVLAFASDPMTRWSWPGQRQYLATMPQFVPAFGGKAFAAGSAYCSDDYAGVALWLPPGIEADMDPLVQLVQSTFPASQLEHAFAIFEEMGKYHPDEPHWYLPLIGVDPVHQGKGHGDALMAHALACIDQDRAPAYLESSNPRNISLYLRHGFEPLGTIQAGSSPPIVPMLRKPR